NHHYLFFHQYARTHITLHSFPTRRSSDLHSVKEACESIFPEKGEAISMTWRKKQLEYCFQRQMMGRYRPFDEVTRDALHYACKSEGANPTKESEDTLMDAYLKLGLFDEVED